MKATIALSILISILSACATPTQSQVELDSEVRRLCAIDGGVKVYESVELPREQYDVQGNPRLPSKATAKPTDAYYFEREYSELTRSGNASITRTVAKIVRRSDQKVLGTSTWYSRAGGDPVGPWHPSSFICPVISPGAPSVESQVFSKERK